MKKTLVVIWGFFPLMSLSSLSLALSLNSPKTLSQFDNIDSVSNSFIRLFTDLIQLKMKFKKKRNHYGINLKYGIVFRTIRNPKSLVLNGIKYDQKNGIQSKNWTLYDFRYRKKASWILKEKKWIFSFSQIRQRTERLGNVSRLLNQPNGTIRKGEKIYLEFKFKLTGAN